MSLLKDLAVWPVESTCIRPGCGHHKVEHRLVILTTKIYRGACKECECVKFMGEG